MAAATINPIVDVIPESQSSFKMVGDTKAQTLIKKKIKRVKTVLLEVLEENKEGLSLA
jgi:hypothetical protein